MSTTTFFYDGQIRRYLLQIIRLLSNFAVKYSDGTLVRVPVIYGDPDRQAASIINQNSENTIQSSPKIAVYMSELELDVNRLSDSSFVGKINIRQREYNPITNQYENYQGGNFTVERLMPTPYKLTVKVDIWSTSNDQKLQILEQLLMLFNPSLEIQTSDNFVDWTSLTVVDLVSTTISSRSIPVGTATEIDIATLTLSTPIWISPPAKVKRMGVVTEIISSILSSSSTDNIDGLGSDPLSMVANSSSQSVRMSVTIGNQPIEVFNDTIRLSEFSSTLPTWEHIINKYPGTYRAGLSKIYIQQMDGRYVVGYFSINPLDTTSLSVNWDPDTYPSNSVIPSNVRSSTGTFDAIIDPKKTGPRDPKLPALIVGSRYLLVDNIGGGVRDTIISETSISQIKTNVLHSKVNSHRVFVNGDEVGSTNIRVPNNLETGKYVIILDNPAPAGSDIRYEVYVNEDGPDAWKNADGSDFIANENDIIEWDGQNWSVVFDSQNSTDKIIFLTNIFTKTQYKWSGVEWSKSFEGLYRKGEWRIEL